MNAFSTDQAFEEFLEARHAAMRRSWVGRLASRLDRVVLRDDPEYLETADLPLDKRFSLVAGLSRLNDRCGYTAFFLRQFRKLIGSIDSSRREGPLSILDVGAGGGGLLAAIHGWSRRRGLEVELTGLDLCEEFQKRAEKRLHARGVPVRFVQGNACDLQAFADDSFDVVLSSYMVHHIRNASALTGFFSEVYRVARLGWLVADLDRPFWGPAYMQMAYVFGTHPRLVGDGVKSIRRAYRPDEINFLLGWAEGARQLEGMHCRKIPALPYWTVRGTKKTGNPA